MQFAYYGMPTGGDEMLEKYGLQVLSNKDEAKKIYDKMYENKIVGALTDQVTVADKNVSVEEFNKLFEKK